MVTVQRDALEFDAPTPLGHPERLGLPVNHTTGPEIGERLHDFALPDAWEKSIPLHSDRAGERAVVVFYRSAVW